MLRRGAQSWPLDALRREVELKKFSVEWKCVFLIGGGFHDPFTAVSLGQYIGMITLNEAEELRRAMGFKRSEKRMQDVELKLRRGSTKNNIEPVLQERIIQSITSFALYRFPESHAASFALIAYASAYLKSTTWPHSPCAF